LISEADESTHVFQVAALGVAPTPPPVLDDEEQPGAIQHKTMTGTLHRRSNGLPLIIAPLTLF
jgi:hypothetical protein